MTVPSCSGPSRRGSWRARSAASRAASRARGVPPLQETHATDAAQLQSQAKGVSDLQPLGVLGEREGHGGRTVHRRVVAPDALPAGRRRPRRPRRRRTPPPGAAPATVVGKIAADQLTMAPLGLSTFLVAMSLLSGGTPADGTDKAFPTAEIETFMTREAPQIYYDLRRPETNTQHIFLAFFWLAMANSALNPLIYFSMHAK